MRSRSILLFLGLAGSLLISCAGLGIDEGGASRRALIIVDMQNDFCPPDGALKVEEGDQIVGLINQLQPEFDLVVATQDWHPPNHKSFASNQPGKEVGDEIVLGGVDQQLWEDHCLPGSLGAELHAELDQSRIACVFRKGMDPEIDSYSGFFDNGKRKGTFLDVYLKAQRVSEVFVVGLATEYCVKFTALDAHELGFATTLIEDATRALKPIDGRHAVQAMVAAGIEVVQSSDLLGAR